MGELRGEISRKEEEGAKGKFCLAFAFFAALRDEWLNNPDGYICFYV